MVAQYVRFMRTRERPRLQCISAERRWKHVLQCCFRGLISSLLFLAETIAAVVFAAVGVQMVISTCRTNWLYALYDGE